MKKGSLIVIEGIDGSGKTTQIELLRKALASQGEAWEAISFPRYEDNIYGKLVKRYLEGEFGTIKEVNPYLLACVYAGDRLLAEPQIKKWLSEGKIVLVNRYVASSKAHLGANLPESSREEFFIWLERLEYETHGMPKEDLTFLLQVDPAQGQKNVLKSHLSDIHEESLIHLKKANQIFLELAEKEKNWQIIDCMDGKRMRSPEAIHKQITACLAGYFETLKNLTKLR